MDWGEGVALLVEIAAWRADWIRAGMLFAYHGCRVGKGWG